MKKLKYCFYVILSKLFRGGHEWILKYYRKQGMDIGENTHIFSYIVSGEPYLIKIGKNCTIATNVSLLTHDASVGATVGRSIHSDLCGKIQIGNNCFVGDKSIIMYGVSISDNVIVAAGSVVTKSVNEPGIIVAGVPAKKIGSVKDFIDNHENYFLNLHGLKSEKRKEIILNNLDKLVVK